MPLLTSDRQKASWFRAICLGLVLGAPALLSGCADDGYGGKETSQEFEKPADMKPAGTTPDPPDDDPR